MGPMVPLDPVGPVGQVGPVGLVGPSVRPSVRWGLQGPQLSGRTSSIYTIDHRHYKSSCRS